MNSEQLTSYAKSAGEFFVGLVIFLGTLSKIKPIEMWLETKTKKWLSRQPERQFVRRIDQAKLDQIVEGAKQELETICIILLAESRADRVTVIQYEKQADGNWTSTCLAEQRTRDTLSIRHLHQQTTVPPELWAEISRVHELEGRFLYVRNARLLDQPVLRTAMLRTGIISAYYQTLPDAASDCGALLSLSWKEPTALDAEELAHLHLSARILGAMLREHWHLKPDAN